MKYYFCLIPWIISFMISLFVVNFVSAQVTPGIRAIHASIEILLSTRLPPYRPKTQCSEQKMQEIRALAEDGGAYVVIDCSCRFRPGEIITKRLLFEGMDASTVLVEGNGAILKQAEGTEKSSKPRIEIRSRSYLAGSIRKWEAPHNIVIRNLDVTGNIRIWGMAYNGQGREYNDNGVMVNHFKNSSKRANHTQRARTNAPSHIILDSITITGEGTNPLYFAPGVTYSKLINSEIKGYSNAVAVYLDAESCCNTLKNNYIHVATGDHAFDTWDRPLIAIDGSSSNYLVSNYFSGLSNGGIYLYRNCGEGGVVRHSGPTHNQIINNIFYYNHFSDENPSVYLSSKNAEFLTTGGWFGFCEDDAGSPYGSSESNLDFARYNVVMQNRIFKRPVSEMILTKNPSVNFLNYVDYNYTVQEANRRRAGCYIGSKGYRRDFIDDGETIQALQLGADLSTWDYSCSDGELTKGGRHNDVTRRYVDCIANGNNNGCVRNAVCPPGQRIVGVTAAGNLESGTITEAMLGTVPTNMMEVLKKSDNEGDGLMWVGGNKLKSGFMVLKGIDGTNSVTFGCKENDANGGDCHIKILLYCMLDE